MASLSRQSHVRPQLVAAEDIVCRRLHVEESSSGLGSGGGGGSGSFSTLTVTVSTSLAGPITVTGVITSNNDIFCRNLTASQTVTANALSAPSAAITAFTSAPTFSAGATVSAGQTVVLTGATLSGGPTLSGGATVSAGQTLVMTGANLSGGPALTGGATVTAGQTLVMTGATLSGGPTLSGGATVSAGQTLVMTGATLSGGPTLSGGATVSPGQTLSFTGGTIDGGGTGAINAIASINGLQYPPQTHATGTRVVVPPGSVFPTLTLPNSPAGNYVVSTASFSGQATNGTAPASNAVAWVYNTAAKITGISYAGALMQLQVLNTSPYTFNITGIDMDMAQADRIWGPLSTLTLTRPSSTSSSWTGTCTTSSHVCPWSGSSPGLLSSADCTFNSCWFTHRMDLIPLYKNATGPSVTSEGGGVRISGQVQTSFTKGAADPVLMRFVMPVGPTATATWVAAGAGTPAAPADTGYWLGWISDSEQSSATLTTRVGGGSMGRDNTTLVLSDATARVDVFMRRGDANINAVDVLISGFTGGAGTYDVAFDYTVVCGHHQLIPVYN